MEFLSFCILVSIIACAVIFCYVKNNPPWLAFPSSASQFLSSIFDAKANDLEAINVESTQHEPLRRGQKAVFSNTKLTDEEIFRMSVKIGEDWNKLAGLMNIPHDQQEEINSSDYPSHSSKAEQILLLFNESMYFSRNALKKFFKKLGRNDLEIEMLPVTNQCELRHECCQEQIECEMNDDYSGCYHQYVKVNPPLSLELWSYLRRMWVLMLQNFHVLHASLTVISYTTDSENLIMNLDRNDSEKEMIPMESQGKIGLEYWEKTVKVQSFKFHMALMWCLMKEMFFGDDYGQNPVFWNSQLPPNKEKIRKRKNSKTIPRMSHVANTSFNRHSSALMPFVLAFFLFGPVNANVQEHYGQNAVLWKTKLTYEEITRMSVKVGPDWDKLAALMDIPYYQREEIRLNSSKYPNFYSKAEQVLVYFNKRRSLTRHHLNNFFKELDRYDLKNEMLPAEIQGGSYKEENAQLQEGDSIFDSNDTLHLRDDTPLSSREMYKFSLRIPNWNALAGHMNVSSAERNDIRNNSFYPDNRSKAEKILWIFNTREDFSREKLAHGLKEISQPQLIKPVINGEWRSCELKHEEREEQLEVPERIPRKEKFPRNPSNRRSSWFPRFLLAFLFSSVVNNNIPERHDEKPILWSRELTSGEITRMSVKVGADWDKLAGLLDIPFPQREEIRLNYSKYPDLASKAVQVFVHFNKSKGFSRHDLKKFFKELGRHDLEIELISVGNQSVTYKEESASSISECFVHENIGKPYLRDDIRLSSREMCKLGGDIADSWYTLAGLLNISYPRRNDIRNNVLYHDNRSRAEKILSIFNDREDFSRLKLANFLKEISQQQLVNPVITGELRNVIPKRARFAHHRSKRNFPALFRLVLGVFLGSAVNNNEQDHYGEKPVSWNTKLSNEEIIGISQEVGADWDKLAGLMNVPYNKREEIRFNFSSFSSKAEQSLRYYNESKVFSRHDLKKIFKELDRSDLETQMVSLGIQSGNNGTENASARSECSIYSNSSHLQDKPLSSRETCRLSQKIGDWDTLAGVMNIPSAERTNIRNNNLYYDDCSRAEKILSLFNNREDFSRERLASHFEEISELYLKNMVETGELRSL